MAMQFHPLPTEVFPEEARRYITRLNLELRDLFALEGNIRNPLSSRASDRSVVRRGEVQVAASRITPTVTTSTYPITATVGTPALVLSTSNLIGSTTTAISINSTIAIFGTQLPFGIGTVGVLGTSAFAARADHAHGVTLSAHSGGYATAATAGSGSALLRADGVFVFPEALGTLADRTKKMTLTDSTLTFALGHTVDAELLIDGTPITGGGPLSLKAPAASQSDGAPMRIGRYGNIGIGAQPTESVMLTVSINPALASLNALTGPYRVWSTNAILSPDNGTASLFGIDQTLTFTPSVANAAANTANKFRFTHGANATGALTLFDIGATLSGTKSTGDFIVVKTALLATAGTRTATTVRGYQHLPGTGTFTTQVGWECGAVTGGLTRQNFKALGATTLGVGATDCMGFTSLSHTVGTNRFSFWGDNMMWCDDSDYVCNTAAKGMVCKDAQGTPEFWRIYPSVSGTTVKDATWTTDVDGFASFTRAAAATGSVILNVQDTGTSAPTA